ncbi:MAG TPA: hypothetical protein VNN06_08095 [Ramlibacter sp.]|nr:hypothetical protein [Ramlibacter sp.]
MATRNSKSSPASGRAATSRAEAAGKGAKPVMRKSERAGSSRGSQGGEKKSSGGKGGK